MKSVSLRKVWMNLHIISESFALLKYYRFDNKKNNGLAIILRARCANIIYKYYLNYNKIYNTFYSHSKLFERNTFFIVTANTTTSYLSTILFFFALKNNYLVNMMPYMWKFKRFCADNFIVIYIWIIPREAPWQVKISSPFQESKLRDKLK